MTEQPPRGDDFRHILAQIAETQHQIAETQRQIAETQQQLTALLAQFTASAPRPTSIAPADTSTSPAAQSTPPGPSATSQPAPPQQAHGPLVIVREERSDERIELYPNGISGVTGQPLLQIDAAAIHTLKQNDPDWHDPESPADEDERDTLLRPLYQKKVDQFENTPTLGTVAGIDENKLDESRWAVVVHQDDDAALLKALSPLIEHRGKQQGIEHLRLEFRAGETCGAWLARHVADVNAPLQSNVPVLVYGTGETCNQWLARHNASQGPVDPQQDGVPFYLMLVGRPGPLNASDTTFIPFSFQYELDIFWGVGRLCFNDLHGHHDLAAYAAYAEQVVAFEQAAPPYDQHAVFFGTRHQYDTATERSADELIIPLSDAENGIAQRFGFSQEVFLADQATHATLSQILQGKSPGGPPAVLFTATHGIGLPADHADVIKHQGALVCHDWTGVGNIKREHWFAAEDLTAQTQVTGLIGVCFACYGAGCPQEDQFVFEPGKPRPVIAPHALVAQFPQALLKRGALAVLGHVERAWTHSFSDPESKIRGQPRAFEDVLGRIFEGKRLGHVTDQFNMRQGMFAMRLTTLMNEMTFGKEPPLRDLSALWSARNDARNYALLGDPAVRLPPDLGVKVL